MEIVVDDENPQNWGEQQTKNKKQNTGPGGRGGLKNEISSMAGLGGRGAEVKETHT